MDILRKDTEVKAAPPLATGGGRDERVATTLGEDTTFEGNLKFANTLRIEGKFKGQMESDGQLIVAKTGVVEADIKVGGVTVDGKITGNITASDLVELRSTAEVHGDITASRLKVEDGVVFVGRADVTPSGRRSGKHAGAPAPGGAAAAAAPEPAKELAKKN